MKQYKQETALLKEKNMVDERKVRLMTRLARYEQKEGRDALRIQKYYRSDYLGLALLRNFFMASIGYGLLVLLIVGYYSDYLMDYIYKMDLQLVVTVLIVGYVAVLAVYSAVTYVVYSVRYARAKKSVKSYYLKLGELEKLAQGKTVTSEKKRG